MLLRRDLWDVISRNAGRWPSWSSSLFSSALLLLDELLLLIVDNRSTSLSSRASEYGRRAWSDSATPVASGGFSDMLGPCEEEIK
jgi:hypothetical protein